MFVTVSLFLPGISFVSPPPPQSRAGRTTDDQAPASRTAINFQPLQTSSELYAALNSVTASAPIVDDADVSLSSDPTMNSDNLVHVPDSCLRDRSALLAIIEALNVGGWEL